MTKAIASELHRLSEIDRADALLRAWISGAAERVRSIRCRVIGGEAHVEAWAQVGSWDERLVAAGYSTRGLLAAMVDCARRLEPGFRSAETLPAPADAEAPAVTIPAPAPTGVR